MNDSAVAAMAKLDVELEELPRWNCCGAVYSLADDDLLHLVAPVRDLVRVKDLGYDKVVTVCSMCYNTLARANKLMRESEEKRYTINSFMEEESDYAGEVEVLHLLPFLRDHIGLGQSQRESGSSTDRYENFALLRLYPDPSQRGGHRQRRQPENPA